MFPPRRQETEDQWQPQHGWQVASKDDAPRIRPEQDLHRSASGICRNKTEAKRKKTGDGGPGNPGHARTAIERPNTVEISDQRDELNHAHRQSEGRRDRLSAPG